jgi:prepilin-type N-terminal cleavage/methylation domain-containing protein
MAPASTTKAAASRVRRSGFTLFEILLVVALFVVVAAVAMPLVSNAIAHARLENSGELVRAAWGRARLAAMRAGEPYVFRYEPEGSRYQIAQLAAINGEDAGDLNSLPAESDEDEEYNEADMLRLAKNRLPTEIIFAAGDVAAVPQMAGAAVATSGGWSQPIMFYADGTTSDATVVITNDSDETLRVTLRGLTGISRAGDVGKEELR